MSRTCTLLITAAMIVGVGADGAPSSRALAVTQHPLPPYRCGSGRCAPSPAVAILADGEHGVLASGVEGGERGVRLFSEITLGADATITPGPVGVPALQLVRGLDGNPWALGHVGANAAVLDVTSHGTLPLYVYPTADTQPVALAAGLGAAWLVNGDVERVGADGHLESFALPSVLPLDSAREIVAGPGESAWFTDGDGAIGQITAAGEVVEHSSETEPLDPLRANPQPIGIAAGPDGAVWYTDWNHARVSRITTSGAVQEFPIPKHNPPYALGANDPAPEDIVAGPEGRYMYFTDPGDNAIGRVSMSGEVGEYPIPSLAPVDPGRIVAVGDELVFTERNASALGSVDPAGSPGDAQLATPPAISEIAASLRTQLTSAAATAKRALGAARRRFTVPFAALEAGTLTIAWIAEARAEPPGHHALGRTRPPVRVATAQGTFIRDEERAIAVNLTTPGRRLLAHVSRHSPVKLTVQATFSGYWSGSLQASAREQLGRP
jgi:virginiamycin B lyase